MRQRSFSSVIAFGLVLAAAAALAGEPSSLAQTRAAPQPDVPPASVAGGKTAAHFMLTSPDFSDGGALRRTEANTRCGGRNISPALEWRNPPDGTQSYILLMHDPDAPGAEGFWHWIAYDIPASATSLPANAGDVHKKLMPAGTVQARSDFGNEGYGGPCPPPGKAHRYFFRLYAMPVTRLNVPADATATIISSYANATALGKAQLMGLYGR
ncbi:MAG TPA: YbhB/YbcL family Raf kinase inhibitor-like protein [Steroidobacteraceae bacterium]|nr:YbhB/YbcL family Raf kinase inhibitor-like protein [Steroidobacteraceae bacterium]